ncbi:GtrA family protein [Ramlibacter sp. MMS24-I3-19]|uniref:GtrA family protein n=1 Tax=Ramlibacter sp. MMS24-I3-19 TaxID=3416606 RepID=UPI003D0003E2
MSFRIRSEGVSRQFVVFLIGGVLSALVDVGCMTALLRGGMRPVLAASFAMPLGVVVNYSYHAKVTFGARITGMSITKYLVVLGINYLTTVGMVWISDQMFAGPLIGKVASLPVVAMTTFVLGRHWAFR